MTNASILLTAHCLGYRLIDLTRAFEKLQAAAAAVVEICKTLDRASLSGDEFARLLPPVTLYVEAGDPLSHTSQLKESSTWPYIRGPPMDNCNGAHAVGAWEHLKNR